MWSGSSSGGSRSLPAERSRCCHYATRRAAGGSRDQADVQRDAPSHCHDRSHSDRQRCGRPVVESPSIDIHAPPIGHPHVHVANHRAMSTRITSPVVAHRRPFDRRHCSTRNHPSDLAAAVGRPTTTKTLWVVELRACLPAERPRHAALRQCPTTRTAPPPTVCGCSSPGTTSAASLLVSHPLGDRRVRLCLDGWPLAVPRERCTAVVGRSRGSDLRDGVSSAARTGSCTMECASWALIEAHAWGASRPQRSRKARHRRFWRR
jgi:hypothetical protein